MGNCFTSKQDTRDEIIFNRYLMGMFICGDHYNDMTEEQKEKVRENLERMLTLKKYTKFIKRDLGTFTSVHRLVFKIYKNPDKKMLYKLRLISKDFYCTSLTMDPEESIWG